MDIDTREKTIGHFKAEIRVVERGNVVGVRISRFDETLIEFLPFGYERTKKIQVLLEKGLNSAIDKCEKEINVFLSAKNENL